LTIIKRRNINAPTPFSTFQDENSQKERYNERRYKFYFFFLFGNFLLKCEKNNERDK
jgi:hypothetical protein